MKAGRMCTMKSRYVVILSALFLSFAGCAGKPVAPPENSGQVDPLVGSYQVHRYDLQNGLRLLVVEDHSSPTFAYQTWFKVGSRNEVPKYTGLAHLFEHMMFKGTKNHKEGEFDRILESSGVEGENAFTSRDYTAYIQELPTNKLDLIAQLEADRMVNLIVDEESFKTEREVVQNERRYRTENNPDGMMYQEMFELAFTAHPYHWPVIGYSEDLERMTSAEPRNFYKSYYSPNHATVVVVGDVNPSNVYDIVKKYYGDLPRIETPPPAVSVEPEQTSTRRKNLKLNIQVEKVLIGFHIPALTDKDTPAIETLMAILTGGKSSRLNRALVDTGIATDVDSYSLDDKDPSLLIITINMQKGKKAAQAEAVVQRELNRLAREPVSEMELARAKNRQDFDFYEGLGNNYEKAQFLGHYEALTGNFEEGLIEHQKIQQVSTADVLAVAKLYTGTKNRSVVTGVPK
jgi:zinc protease